MLFKEIIGQKEVKKRLLNLVGDDRTPHALMLFGPPGTGKRSLAVAMTQYLSCADRQPEDACGVCPSCVKFSKLVHPDLHFVVPVMKTQKVVKDPETDLFIEAWSFSSSGSICISHDQRKGERVDHQKTELQTL